MCGLSDNMYFLILNTIGTGSELETPNQQAQGTQPQGGNKRKLGQSEEHIPIPAKKKKTNASEKVAVVDIDSEVTEFEPNILEGEKFKAKKNFLESLLLTITLYQLPPTNHLNKF